MAYFTDIFIKRPVLATVISLVILTLGLRSAGSLPILQYPFTQNAVVTVATTYTGANPELVAGFITTPLENSISQASGIDYMTSSSTLGQSQIQANLLLNYDPIEAVSEINTKVNAVLNQLPPQSQQPTISVAIGETIDSMYIGFYSTILNSNQITDYLIRVVQPKLQAIDGVQQAEILGQRSFAMRAWLDPQKLAGFKLTPADVFNKLNQNNFISAAGQTKGQMFTLNLTASTNLNTTEQFENLVLKSENGAIIRLGDVSHVQLGSQNYNTAVQFDGKPAVYVGIKITPSANLLSVTKKIREVFPDISAQLPEGLSAKIVYDSSAYVTSAISEVVHSLIEAFLIVTVVIFLFLGSFRSVLIPTIAIPLSIIGAFLVMLLLGYSINLLTLLALVLAIGLVVDDAIIVVENIHRHIEEGKSPFEAAIMGARELGGPIISISIVLIAVYIPIGFMGGLTGALFTEFAFSLAGAVAISGIIALTLSPMMCAKFLKPSENNHSKNRLNATIDHLFEKLKNRYHVALSNSLNYLPIVLVFAVIILLSNYFLFITSTNELAPQEDQGIILGQLTTAANATLQQTQMYSKLMNEIYFKFKATNHTFIVDGYNGFNTSISGMVLKPWDEREMTANQIQPQLQQMLDKISGGKVAAFQKPSLPGGGSGTPIQFVIQSTHTFDEINPLAQKIIEEARKTGLFLYLDSDLKIDKEQSSVIIDRDKTSELGLTMQEVGNSLTAALSENYVNYFDMMGRSYQVIPQVSQINRLNDSQLLDYYINTSNGTPISLATLAHMQTSVVPESINHFQQLNSATISAVTYPNITMGQALETFKNIASKILPTDYSVDYAGQSRQFMQESSALVVTFFFALIIIYLCLAAQFESFRDPIIVLISVPMSICGAMIFISMGIGSASLNIYSEVGLVTLIGLISKHGILIVQFANDLQQEGKNKKDAVLEAASIRLRPILMTTAAMVLGVFPLIIATGAGALSRYNIGLVIAAGIAIGTVFTLFVVPAMYMILAEEKFQQASDEQALIPKSSSY